MSYCKLIKFKISLLKRTNSETKRDRDTLPVARMFETNTLKCWQSTVGGIQYKNIVYSDVMDVLSCMRSLLAGKLRASKVHTQISSSEAEWIHWKQYMHIHSNVLISCCLLISYTHSKNSEWTVRHEIATHSRACMFMLCTEFELTKCHTSSNYWIGARTTHLQVFI